MNFAIDRHHAPWVRYGVLVFILVLFSVIVAGCGDNITLPSEQQLAEFQAAGPIKPQIDVDSLVASQTRIKDYRLNIGDLLAVDMPALLVRTASQIGPQTELNHIHITRIDPQGMMTIPIVGKIQAAGLDISQAESAIAAAYYPKYINQAPSIVVRITEYKTRQVSVTGAVKNPGVYELPTHRMTLVSAIMAAGGIVDTGAAVIWINQSKDKDTLPPQENGNPPVQDNTLSTESLPGSQIHLSFQQTDATGKGVISVLDDQKLLYSEKLDVTSGQERTRVLENIHAVYPQVSSNYVRTRLDELSELIKPGSGNSSKAINDKFISSGISGQTDQLQDYYIKKKSQTTGQEQAPETWIQKPAATDKPFLLPVKGLNIPFTDVALKDRASITVEPIDPQVFTVIGLVKQPGAFPYPPNVQYNLLQALAFAGGVDELANPRYLRVYRRTNDDKIVDAAFEIKGTVPTSAIAMLIKPGDVVAVEQTPRTHTNLIISQVLRFNFGIMSVYDFAGND